MENLEQTVNATERTFEISNQMKTDRVGNLREYIAELVEMAYIAGTNKVNLRRTGSAPDYVTTGEVVVFARNYVKDKGLRI